ncbi:MAG: S41 family peptidase [Symbiobacteriaceae bacterium]|nr:S41 family peptidase [Symbiobacteriaceae bacterium]
MVKKLSRRTIIIATIIGAIALVYALYLGVNYYTATQARVVTVVYVNTTPLDEWMFDELLSREEVQADARELVRVVEETHPLFIGEPHPQYLAEKERFMQVASTSLTREEFWLQCAYYLASLKDAHTNIGRGRRLNLELPVRWHGEKLFATTGEILPEGSQIISIADIPVEDLLPILDRLMGFENESGLVYNRNTFATRQFIHVAAGATKTPSARVVFNYQGVISAIDVDYSPPGSNQISPVERPKSFTFQSLDYGKIALITASSCNMDDDWRRTCEELKAAVRRGVRKVIMDVRDNAGGDDRVWAPLLSAMNMEAGHGSYGELLCYTPTVVSKIVEYKGRSGVSYKEPRNSLTNKNNIELVVLVNEVTYSTTVSFLGRVHDAGHATLVGTQPRHNASYPSFPLYYRLEHSQFVVAISHVMYIRPNPLLDADNPGFEIIPVVEGQDELEVALSMLKG